MTRQNGSHRFGVEEHAFHPAGEDIEAFIGACRSVVECTYFVALAREFAHAVFAIDVPDLDAEFVAQRLSEFGLGNFARSPLISARFE